MLRDRRIALPEWAIAASRKPLSFVEFVTLVKPRYIWYQHCLILADILQRVADGELSRVMIFMPPRHGKSEAASRMFTAYLLYRFPERYVGLCSYSAALAFTLSRASRDNYITGGGTLSKTTTATEHWETGKGGGMWAAGVGGPITGKGFHVGIIDDPIKNSDEARSETIRENIKEWYQSTFYTREEPGGAIVIIQTRWHEEDLAGWLLSEADDDGDQWFALSMPALSETEDFTFEATLPSFAASCQGLIEGDQLHSLSECFPSSAK